MLPKKFVASLFSGIWLLASPSSLALTDTNANGLGDLWEKNYNSNSLFSNTDPTHAPTADADSDGWTNLQESTAGTNPFVAIAGQGMLTPAVAYTPAIREPAPPGAEIGQPGVAPPPTDPTDPTEPGTGGATFTEPLQIRRPARFTLTWQPVPGKAYRIEQSTDLATWQPTTGFYMGGSSAITYQGEAIYSDNTEPPKFFHRIKIEDADNDGDGLTDYEESLLHTDPYAADTDRDGIPDQLDPQPLINALQAAWDADATDPTGATLFAAFNFTPPATGVYPFNVQQVIDVTGNARHGIARNQTRGAPQIQNPPMANAEGISNNGFQCSNTHHFAFAQQNPPINFAPVLSLSFWVRLHASDIDTAPQPIFSYVPRAADSTVPSAEINKHVIRAFLTKNATNTGYEIVWRNWQSPAFSLRERWALDLPSPRIEKRWLNLTFVWQGNGSGQGKLWACYANGIKQTRSQGSPYTLNTSGTTQNSPQDTFLIGADASGGAAGNNLSNIASTFRGTFDRVRFHTTALTQEHVTAIVTQDTDGDQLWDTTETEAAAWYDINSNGKRDPGEINYGDNSPLQWQSLTTDTDEDDLTDVAEQALGTLINRTDSDGDRLSDGWEVKHSLNPLLATGIHGKDGDPDGDGVTNINEYRYHTKPTQLPGDPPIPQPGSSHNSDGDSSSDFVEWTQGSHGGNSNDHGQPLPAEEKITIDLGIGDQSDSESEDYTMVVSEIDPETGDEKEHFRLDADGFGEYKTASPDIFYRGHTYSFQIVWNGSNRTNSSTGSESTPDLDYTFKVEPQGEGTGFLIDSYDPRLASADLTKPLLGDKLNNTAPDESTFRKTIQNRRVILMGVSTISADRMFGASMQVLPGLEDIQLEITNSVTQEDFGTHSQLFAKAYESYEAILGHGDNFGKNVADPRVWFIKDEFAIFPSIQTYLCGDPALPPGEINIRATFRGTAIGSVKRALTAHTETAAFLGRATNLAAGTAMGFPVAAGQPADGAPASGKSHHWAAALAIPVMMIEHALEGQTLLVTGVFDGIHAGLSDDWAMVIFVRDGVVDGANWSAERAMAYLSAWRTDPAARMQQVKDTLTRFLRNHVCDPFKNQVSKLATVQGVLDTLWDLSPTGVPAKIAQGFNTLVGGNPWAKFAESIGDWFDDFNNRMLIGAEKAAWASEPFPDNALVAGAEAFRRTFIYATGYGMGYLAEQVAVGIVTGKAFTIAGGLTKGTQLVANGVSRLATRCTATIAARAQILKRWGASAGIATQMRIAIEEGFTLAARTPTPGVVNGKNILSTIVESYDALPTTNTTASIKNLVDGLLDHPRLAAQNLTPGGTLRALSATARLQSGLGTQATEKAVRNWPKLANAIATNGESGLADDFLRYADFEQAMKLNTPQGKIVARDLLESLDNKTAQQVLEGDIFMPPSIKQLYPQMYHYADFDTMKFFAEDFVGGVSGRWKILENQFGRYVSPELINTQALAKSKLQLPLNGALQEVPTKGRFRFEYTTSNLAGDYRIPRAFVHSGANNSGEKAWREFIVKDNSTRGTGGVLQLVENAEREGTLFDTMTQQFVRDKAHLREILDTNP